MDRRGHEEPGEARRSQKSQEEPGGCIKASKTTIGSEKIGVGLPTNHFFIGFVQHHIVFAPRFLRFSGIPSKYSTISWDDAQKSDV